MGAASRFGREMLSRFVPGTGRGFGFLPAVWRDVGVPVVARTVRFVEEPNDPALSLEGGLLQQRGPFAPCRSATGGRRPRDPLFRAATCPAYSVCFGACSASRQALLRVGKAYGHTSGAERPTQSGIDAVFLLPPSAFQSSTAQRECSPYGLGTGYGISSLRRSLPDGTYSTHKLFPLLAWVYLLHRVPSTSLALVLTAPRALGSVSGLRLRGYPPLRLRRVSYNRC
jgi:hypothetical protein